MNAVATGAIFGFLGVAAGAFGAHGLASKLDAYSLDIFKTAAHYQMLHALALVAYGIFSSQRAVVAQYPAWCFALGTVVFSGSLYMLSLTGIRWLGAITPIGGVLFLVGWAGFAWTALQSK